MEVQQHTVGFDIKAIEHNYVLSNKEYSDSNSLVYLMNHYDKNLLKKYRIIAYTFILNLFLVGVNQVTGGNYGLLNTTPFISDAPIWIKYLLVSIILSAALVLFDILFKKRWKKKIALENIKF